ncbi:MAG: leucine-rich repeat domain-containing protein [Paludibacteraceae bacterium]|nr:leucine-rich repeat domain-containing protein [Paludibacteraceae bacterium]
MKTINSFRSKLFALTFALMASVSTFAYDFQDGYLFYNILADGTVAVTNERLGLPYNNLPASLVIPSEVTGNYGAKYQVSEIANYAFQGCDKLESLVIPNTVKKIGVYAFTGCSKLLNISFPESLEDVMAGALYECAWYDNQPDGLVYVGNLLYRYKGIAPTGVITINEGTKAVLGLAFSNQPNITSVILPESVTSVHMQAFGDCPNLESVTLPTWLSVIEDYTFQNCSKLQNINLPLGLDQIGKGAFAGCSSLTILDWPLQLKNIGARAFYNCNQLDGIENISPNIEKIGANAFGNTAWESKQPSGYLYIHNIFYAYNGEVTDSMHIEIKKGTTYISGGAVSRCVTKINEYSTKNVVSKITIPNSVTEIEDETFRSCHNLDTIICTSVQPPLISENTFNLTLQKNKHVLLVPIKALDIYSWWGLRPYEAAPYWNNFTNVKPITDPYVYDPMYFEKDSIQYHITNDTLAPYEVEVTHWYGLEQWEMEGYNYPELTTADIPASVTYKGTTYLVTRVGKKAFYYAPQLQHVTIGENVKIIDERAFAVCRNLSQVVIGENVDSILFNAFASGTSKIKVLDIPKNVKFIENKSLSAYSLEAINVHPDNANYTSVDGVLFNKQKNYLQEFPRSKATTYMIPDCVDTIGNLAFASNHNIISISFSPNSQLKHIEKEAFMGCIFMQRLELPTSLQSIEERAFNNCCSLEAITSMNPTPPVMSNRYNYNQQVFGSVSHEVLLFVPAESVELYDAAPQWDRFATILPIGTITMNDFPTLAGLQRTSFNAYMGSSLFSAETNIRYIKDRAYLNFQGFFLREENNQVLIYSRRLEKDLILYDYSLEVGDTLTTLNFDYRHEDLPLTDLVVDFPFTDLYDIYHPIDTLIVTDISYVKLLDDKEYKKWTFDNGMEYVEGIGSFGNRQWSGDFFQLIANRDVPTSLQGEHLVCASRNGKLLYQMDDAEMERLGAECLCDYNSGPKKDNAKNGKIGGRPTPTQWNMLEVETKEMDGTPTILRAETFSYTLENDSIVANNKTFYQLARQSTKDTAITKSFVGALHFGEDEDNRVYFLRDGVEYVLYDFTAEPGDTIEIFAGINNYPQDSTYTHVVTGKDTLENGACRMFLEVVFPDETTTATNVEKVWLAGLGSIDGIVHNAATRATKARSSETQTSVMLCAWRDDDCLYTTDHPDYDSYGCVYNLPTSIKDIETPGGKYQKIIRNGHLYILRDNKLYDVLGTPMN